MSTIVKIMVGFVFSLFLIAIAAFVLSSGPLTSRREATKVSRYLMDNLTNSEIRVSKIWYESDEIRIELYGSWAGKDIAELIELSDRWLEENPDSIIIRNRMRFSIELYEQKPENSERISHSYSCRIANFDAYFAPHVSHDIDCIDINRCDLFLTSYFEGDKNNYRVIMFPSYIVIDDFEVFLNMPELERLVISDYPFMDYRPYLEERYAQIDELAQEYGPVTFNYYISSR